MRSFRLMFASLLILAIVVSCKKSANLSGDNGATPPTNPANSIAVTAIALSTDSIILNHGSAQRLSVAFTPLNATNKKLSWTSSNPSVATVDTTGLITAIGSGDVVISCRSVDNAALAVTAVVLVLGNLDIYIVGEGSYVGAPTSGAAYWVNGIPTLVTDPGPAAINPVLTGITVSGNDIYILGSTHNIGGYAIPTYWKNNNIVQFEAPGPFDDTLRFETAIAVTGNKVHVVGYNFFYPSPSSNNRYYAFHYIDDGGSITVERHPFPSVSSQAFGMAISGNDVYIAGSTNDGLNTAKYWKNNWTLATSLTDGISYAIGQALTVAGNDILVAGREGCDIASCISTIKLWRNNMTNPTVVSDGLFSAEASCMAASGNDIYVAGFQYNAVGTAIGKLWKISGSTVTAVTLSDGQHRTRITGISVKNNDVFVCGYEVRPDNTTRGKYWRLYGSLLIETVPLTWNGFVDASTSAGGIFVK